METQQQAIGTIAWVYHGQYTMTNEKMIYVQKTMETEQTLDMCMRIEAEQ